MLETKRDREREEIKRGGGGIQRQRALYNFVVWQITLTVYATIFAGCFSFHSKLKRSGAVMMGGQNLKF